MGQNLAASQVHLTCAAIIGTALALVLTLSIVPIQKAADVFSSAIFRLYASDYRLLIAFATLSFLALISLLFGTGWNFNISARYTLAAQFVALGLALDAVRGFYTRTLYLLEPTTALTFVFRKCSRQIERAKREAEKLARIYSLSGGEPADDDGTAARWLYYTQSDVSRHLAGWMRQLEEFAHKAVARRDIQATNSITRTMASIGIEYSESRRDSLILVPDFSSPLPTAVSDIRNVLSPIYESIRNICDDAVKHSSEAIVIGCLRALGEMAVHAVTMIDSQNEYWQAAPLSHAPVRQPFES